MWATMWHTGLVYIGSSVLFQHPSAQSLIPDGVCAKSWVTKLFYLETKNGSLWLRLHVFCILDKLVWRNLPSKYYKLTLDIGQNSED